MIKTFKYKIKTGKLNSSDCHWLFQKASAINYIWNYCNNAQKHKLKWDSAKKWLTGFDLSSMCSGVSKEIGLHSQTVQAVCEEYANKRKAKKKAYLRYRSYKKSLGWIPFKTTGIKFDPINHTFTYQKREFQVWYSREIPPDTKIKSGSFCQDSLGNWYINIVVDIPDVQIENKPTAEVGIDLGLKDLAVLSDGNVIPIFKYYRKNEKRLGLAQRANKKCQVKKIHHKIANSRKDSAFKIANNLVKNYALIVVGNVSPSKLAKTKMAKSVYDAGWTLLKKQVEYLAMTHQSVFLEVNESFTTQTCSVCGSRTGPKGLKGLGIREWKCPVCNTVHDRDVNSAKNILRIGHDTLGVGIPYLTADAANISNV